MNRLALFLLFLLLCPSAYGSVPPSLGVAGSAVARGVGHAVTTEAVYGGKFENVLKRSLVSEASAASFKFIGHELKTPDNQKLNLPETTVLHAMVGGTLAQLSGGDFTTGAIATATSHVVAEQVRGHYLNQVIHGDMSMSAMESKVLAITNLVGGASALAVHPNMSQKELAAAQAESASVVQNNSLKLIVTAAKIGKRLYAESRKLKGKLGKADIKRVLKEEGLDIVGDLYTFIDPEASIADMAWAAADLTLGTSFNNRVLAVAKKFGKGKKPSKTVDSILTGTHKYDEPNLNKRINQRADFSSGATHITSGRQLDKRIAEGKTDTIGNPKQLYVLPTYQADKLLNRKGVSKSDIERNLGLDRGALTDQTGPVTRFDIRNPENRNMRMPDPATGNQYHRPKTGLTAGGQTERVIDTPKLNDPGVTRTDLNIPRGAK